MKIGKVPEQVLIRSVLNKIKCDREEILIGPAAGQDCAALAIGGDEAFIISSDPITGTSSDVGYYGIHVTVNDLAAAGSEPVAVIFTMLLPEGFEESELRKIIEDAEGCCRDLGIAIAGGHTEITAAVNVPIITVTGIGRMPKDELISLKQVRPGDELVITKSIALEGTSIIAKEKKKELEERFSPDFVETAANFDKLISVLPESRIAMKQGVHAMHDITEGGIFGALWEMASGSGCGVTCDLKKIPVRQESIEICEYFDINPYMLMSSGSLLIAVPEGTGQTLKEKLEEAGIDGEIIGVMTDSNDKKIINGEEVRYLDRPKSDELYKIK